MTPASGIDFRIPLVPIGFITGDRFGEAVEVATGSPPSLDRKNGLALAIGASEAGVMRGANFFDERGGEAVVAILPVGSSAATIDEG